MAAFHLDDVTTCGSHKATKAHLEGFQKGLNGRGLQQNPATAEGLARSQEARAPLNIAAFCLDEDVRRQESAAVQLTRHPFEVRVHPSQIPASFSPSRGNHRGGLSTKTNASRCWEPPWAPGLVPSRMSEDVGEGGENRGSTDPSPIPSHRPRPSSVFASAGAKSATMLAPSFALGSVPKCLSRKVASAPRIWWPAWPPSSSSTETPCNSLWESTMPLPTRMWRTLVSSFKPSSTTTPSTALE